MDGSSVLTRRERELLQRLAAGASVQQAALDAGCAYGTARKHLSRAYEKLGAHGQGHAVALAIASGVVAIGLVPVQ